MEHEFSAVSARGLVKRYGSSVALADLNLELPAGSVLLLVGPNGAGKSTFFKILLDLVRPDEGAAQIFGMHVSTEGPAVRRMIGWVPEGQDVPPSSMRVGELFNLMHAYYPEWDSAYAKHLTDQLDIQPLREYGSLSKGQRRRVQLVLALAHRPALLLFDEPTDGLDPLARSVLSEILNNHVRSSGTSAIIATHLVQEVERWSDRIAILNQGTLIKEMPLQHSAVRFGWYDIPTFPHDPNSMHGLNVIGRAQNGETGCCLIEGSRAESERLFAARGIEARYSRPASLNDVIIAYLANSGPRPAGDSVAGVEPENFDGA